MSKCMSPSRAAVYRDETQSTVDSTHSSVTHTAEHITTAITRHQSANCPAFCLHPPAMLSLSRNAPIASDSPCEPRAEQQLELLDTQRECTAAGRGWGGGSITRHS
mmetsp:Transcript_13578/g.32323  ORF Transcript_13578/g.32323 Transcript_13578/m.32323 type:complete len:106 (-) Transcript_13578:809-1126(-)